MQRQLHRHTQLGQQRSLPRSVELGRPLAGHAQRAAVLAAGGHRDLHAAVQRGNLDLGAQRRLGEGDRHLHHQVVALSGEYRAGHHAGDHVQVAGRAAPHAGAALALELDAGAVLGALRDAHADAPLGRALARAPAVGAGVVDDGARAAALRACLGDGEAADVTTDGAPPLAGAAQARAAAGRGARPRARGAGLGLLQGHRHLGTGHGLVERQRHLHLQVLAAPGTARRAAAATATAAAATEHGSEDVAQVAEPGATGGAAHAAVAAAHAREPALGVVLLALLGVGQHVVGVRDLLEALLGLRVAGVGVGVVLARKGPVGLLDGIRIGVLGHAEDLVEVLLVQLCSPPCDTTTRAGRMTVSDMR